MLSKNNSKILIVILIILLVIYAAVQLTDHSESNMKTDLVAVDTAQIDKIVIQPPKSANKIVLEKENGKWQVTANNETHLAERRKVNSILGDMLRLKPTGVVATDKNQWEKYEVTDSLGTRVKLLKGDKVKANIILGKFNFIAAKNGQPNPYRRQPQGEMISYVRPYDDDAVYSVDGMIKMSFSANPDNYRDKIFVNVQQNEIKKIDFSYSDSSSFSLVKNDKGWKINYEPVDSATVTHYLRSLNHTNGSKIVHDFDRNNKPQIGKISIERNNAAPVELTAYTIDSSKYVVHSSLNKDAWFDGNSGRLFERFFVDKPYFFKKEKKKK